MRVESSLVDPIKRILFDAQIDAGIDPNDSEMAVAESRKVYKELLHCSRSAVPKR